MNSNELKIKARNKLQGKYEIYLLISFIAILITGAAAEFLIVGMLVTGPIAIGTASVFMKLVRGKKVKVENLFYGFENLLTSFLQELLRGLFTFLWALLFIVPGISKALAYSMTPYILVDNPKLSALEAINKSKDMMYGHKGRLFKLIFSFIGWFVLAILTGGIGFIFLAPYVSATQAEFYQDLLDNRKAK